MKITYPKDGKLTDEMKYRHVIARGTSVKKEDDGTLIMTDSIVAFENEEGNKIVSIIGYKFDKEKNEFEPFLSHYVSSSTIFREDLEKIVGIFGDTGIRIKIRKNTSKQGRTFVFCELA